MSIEKQDMDKLKILKYIIGRIYDGSLSINQVDGDLRQFMMSLIGGVAPDLSIEEQKAIKKMLDDKKYELVIPR